jgi:hypothetical protein
MYLHQQPLRRTATGGVEVKYLVYAAGRLTAFGYIAHGQFDAYQAFMRGLGITVTTSIKALARKT